MVKAHRNVPLKTKCIIMDGKSSQKCTFENQVY